MKKIVYQFIAYFFVGLCAALVEWASFWVFNELLGRGIYVSTAAAFVLATFVNWVIGRKTVFKKAARDKKAGRDAAAVYFVSGIGLGLNMALMSLFVKVIGLYPLISKIISTGIVFQWNFASRRFIIYRQVE
jgi:putative flippase GtrA